MSANIAVLSGFWNLQTCFLSGPFNYDLAVTSLPTTISNLVLWPDFICDRIRLESFARFTSLTKLGVNCQISGDSVSEMESIPIFCIDSTCPSLTHLAVHHPIRCTVAGDCEFSGCLPNLHTLKVNIEADDKGVGLAAEITSSLGVRDLELELWADSQVAIGRGVLQVPESSSLQHLHVQAQHLLLPMVVVELSKANIKFSCDGVGVVTVPGPEPISDWNDCR